MTATPFYWDKRQQPTLGPPNKIISKLPFGSVVGDGVSKEPDTHVPDILVPDIPVVFGEGAERQPRAADDNPLWQRSGWHRTMYDAS